MKTIRTTSVDDALSAALGIGDAQRIHEIVTMLEALARQLNTITPRGRKAARKG
ncbi:hypothetical protein N5079_05345 [Planotetraspora sp. A-T 1434]|uniref:hypothetical protein n=1 Tax=Planotetraspora sp. A-T 1434 TaxID=2979219 RepID=UPI0021C037CD|nr:hypothetical protein [Planotetraspora sp. A-T 1434]MCT9929643.1 hypothetical protein [Planotetraspora sp. A-T 1434]